MNALRFASLSLPPMVSQKIRLEAAQLHVSGLCDHAESLFYAVRERHHIFSVWENQRDERNLENVGTAILLHMNLYSRFWKTTAWRIL